MMRQYNKVSISLLVEIEIWGAAAPIAPHGSYATDILNCLLASYFALGKNEIADCMWVEYRLDFITVYIVAP